MKVFAVLVETLAICALAAGSKLDSGYKGGFLANFETLSADELINFAHSYGIHPYELVRSAISRNVAKKSKDARDPVLPELPDPIVLPDPTEITLDLEDLLTGEVVLRGAVVEGLSTVEDDLATRITLLPLGVVLNFTLDLPWLAFRGTHYYADVLANLTRFGYTECDFSGDGDFHNELKGTHFKLGLSAVLRGINKITIRGVTMDAGFDTISLFFENSNLCGAPVDYWDDINNGLKPIFDYVWVNNKDVIVEVVTTVLNDALVDCTIQQLIAFLQGNGDLDCLILPTLPTTTTTRDPSAPTEDPEITTPSQEVTTSKPVPTSDPVTEPPKSTPDDRPESEPTQPTPAPTEAPVNTTPSKEESTLKPGPTNAPLPTDQPQPQSTEAGASSLRQSPVSTLAILLTLIFVLLHHRI